MKTYRLQWSFGEEYGEDTWDVEAESKEMALEMFHINCPGNFDVRVEELA